MSTERRGSARSIAATAVFAALAAVSAGPLRIEPPGPAYRIIDLEARRTVAEARPEVIDSPVAPGSVLKIATFIAASESGLIDEHTAIVCRRTVHVGGADLTCVHPDLHHALGPTEALAQSCNYFFATVAGRLPRGSLDGVLVRLGLAPLPAGTPTVLGAVGLGGVRASPAGLLAALVRVTGPGPSIAMGDRTRTLLLAGLRDAAQEGTAAAFGRAGLRAYAKTGTAPMPGGGHHGIVVAVLPDTSPRLGIVVLAPGVAGAVAAEIAARLVQEQLRGGRRDARNAADVVPGSARPQAGGDVSQRNAADERDRPAPARSPVVPAGLNVSRQDAIRVGRAEPAGGYRIVTMTIEDYVAGIVAGEAPASTRPAALEALAIAARTFAMANLGRHAREGFDLCDLTHCQVLRSAVRESRRAARATAGQVLLDRGRPARVYLSAWCGGHTERPSNVWPGAEDPPFLPAQPDPFCVNGPAWSSEVPVTRLVDVLHAAGLQGQSITGLSVSSRTESGRAAVVHAAGLAPDDIAAERFRSAVGRLLGWQILKSTLFDIHRTAVGYRFTGRGLGHGVGLCVRGADRRAARGDSALAILGFYFPGLAIGDAAGVVRSSQHEAAPTTGIRVFLPEEDRRDLAAVRDLVATLVADIARRLAVRAPAALEVRFHPTVAAYTERTRQPWWAAGASGEGAIDLLPLDVLRRRGILESTLRHEIVHVLTFNVLAGRPLWVREGLAGVMAGEFASPGAASRAGDRLHRPCPSDREFREAASPDAWKSAYGRAASCVAAAIGRGSSWRDLR